MLNRLTESFDFQAQALKLRSERQKVIAGNIANADTPRYQAVDFNFADALRAATGTGPSATTLASVSTGVNAARTHAQHIAGSGAGAGMVNVALQYRQPPLILANVLFLHRTSSMVLDDN